MLAGTPSAHRTVQLFDPPSLDPRALCFECENAAFLPQQRRRRCRHVIEPRLLECEDGYSKSEVLAITLYVSMRRVVLPLGRDILYYWGLLDAFLSSESIYIQLLMCSINR